MGVEHDFSFQESGQTTTEGQAKPKALAELVDFCKLLEDALMIGRRNTTTRIRYIEAHITGIQLLTANSDGA